MNNEDIDKPLKMATEEQKRVSQIQGFVENVPQKKSRSVWKTRLMIFYDFSKNGIFLHFWGAFLQNDDLEGLMLIKVWRGVILSLLQCLEH